MIKLRHQKILIGGVLMGASGMAMSFGCPPVIDSIWQQGMNAAESTISAAIDSMVNTVSQSHIQNLQRIESGLRIFTKQVEMTSDKGMAIDTSTKEAAANYAADTENHKNVFLTMLEYNPATGQGYKPCVEEAKTQKLSITVGEANESMQNRVLKELDTAPGRVSTNPAATVMQRVTNAKGRYCTADEVKSGFCSSVGAMAGKDVDASYFFDTQTGADAVQAKDDMLNHMYGLPAKAPPASLAKSPSAAAFWSTKRASDAYRSVSQASMKAIQAWTEQNSVTGESVMSAIADKVATYAGGGDYAAWEASKASQSEHGLLVDYAKMQALDLWMSNQQYQESIRMEANLATMLAMRARGMAQSNQAAAATAASRQGGAVK